MDENLLIDKFYADIFPDQPNEWEVEEIFEQLAELDESIRGPLLNQVQAIWPVSHTLCFDFLRCGSEILSHFPPEMLSEWVRQFLSVYEKNGLAGAREFIADVEGSFLAPMRGETGAFYESISVRMQHFIRGVSGKMLELSTAAIPVTDTETIFVPSWLGEFARKEDNELLYKLLLSLQWAHIARNVFHRSDASEHGAPWSTFPDEQLAKDVFRSLQFIEAWKFLADELPGLTRKAQDLCLQLIRRMAGRPPFSSRQMLFVEMFISVLRNPGSDPHFHDEALSLVELYQSFDCVPGDYSLAEVALLLGEFDFQRAAQKIAKMREERQRKFTDLVALFLKDQGALDEEDTGGNEGRSAADSALLILKEQLVDQKKKNGAKQFAEKLDSNASVSDELKQLAQEILNDLGHIPEAYFQAAEGLAGAGFNWEEVQGNVEDALISQPQSWQYDEWDYRRGGYRSDWCNLFEKELNEVRSDFVHKTLKKYQSQLKRIKRQFEALRTKHHFVKRRRDGDEIDLDALIDSLGDSRAGYAPSDRLFVKLLRDDRDITAMFLVDMSNSTEGWVGNAIKEALVLLTEALEVARDRYGIYGFSGMRRSRCKYFRIKDPDEEYSELVKRRIAGIIPMEYTRMGPPIRHITRKLIQEQSRIRILIVLSDGKPEDYDDYKGLYAIEDTRKALMEARGRGIFVFCITIDRAAHEYLEHMFGKGNYIFIENLDTLPGKMTEMYRLLTS